MLSGETRIPKCVMDICIFAQSCANYYFNCLKRKRTFAPQTTSLTKTRMTTDMAIILLPLLCAQQTLNNYVFSQPRRASNIHLSTGKLCLAYCLLPSMRYPWPSLHLCTRSYVLPHTQGHESAVLPFLCDSSHFPAILNESH